MRFRLFLSLVASALLVIGGAFAVFAQDQTYTVEQGDTLDGIAAIFDVQVACLASGNNIGRGDLLKPGQVLNISFDCPRYDGVDFVTNPRGDDGQPAPEPGQGGGDVAPADVTGSSYIVERGDTLDTIGQELNVSSVAIQVANGLRPGDLLVIGQELIIPEGAPPYGQFPALTNPSNPSSPDNELGQGGGGAATLAEGNVEYVVQPLDVLDLIGAEFDAAASCIAADNNLEAPFRIFPGQVLLISTACPRYDGEAFVVNPRG
jgi:LysM repeat protein